MQWLCLLSLLLIVALPTTHAVGIEAFNTGPRLLVVFRWENVDTRILTVKAQDKALSHVPGYIERELSLNSHVDRINCTVGNDTMASLYGLRTYASARLVFAPEDEGEGGASETIVASSTTAQSRKRAVDDIEEVEVETSTTSVTRPTPPPPRLSTFNVNDAADRLSKGVGMLANTILTDISTDMIGTTRRLHGYLGLRKQPKLTIHIVPDTIFSALGPRNNKKQQQHQEKAATLIARSGEGTQVRFLPRIIEGGAIKVSNKPGKGTKLANAPAHLDRLNQVTLPLDGHWALPTALATGPNSEPVIYVMDTGVRLTHVEFAGHVTRIHDQFPGDSTFSGHGTHVASSIVGQTVGVLPQARVYDVRMLDGSGSAYFFDIVVSAEALLAHCIAAGGAAVRGIVINASWGGSSSPNSPSVAPLAAVFGDLHHQCDALIVAAAGNSESSACNTVPAAFSSPSQGGVIAVGAAGTNDVFASFSNHGPCVFINAPGVNVKGAWNTDDTVMAQLSGTSMASPIVAAVAAVHLMQFPANFSAEHPGQLRSDSIKNRIQHDAIGVVTGVPAHTTYGLVHLTSTALDPDAPLEAPVPLTPISSGATHIASVCVECLYWSAIIVLAGLFLI